LRFKRELSKKTVLGGLGEKNFKEKISPFLGGFFTQVIFPHPWGR